jgi:hypothetical protein
MPDTERDLRLAFLIKRRRRRATVAALRLGGNGLPTRFTANFR